VVLASSSRRATAARARPAEGRRRVAARVVRPSTRPTSRSCRSRCSPSAWPASCRSRPGRRVHLARLDRDLLGLGTGSAGDVRSARHRRITSWPGSAADGGATRPPEALDPRVRGAGGSTPAPSPLPRGERSERDPARRDRRAPPQDRPRQPRGRRAREIPRTVPGDQYRFRGPDPPDERPAVHALGRAQARTPRIGASATPARSARREEIAHPGGDRARAAGSRAHGRRPAAGRAELHIVDARGRGAAPGPSAGSAASSTASIPASSSTWRGRPPPAPPIDHAPSYATGAQRPEGSSRAGVHGPPPQTAPAGTGGRRRAPRPRIAPGLERGRFVRSGPPRVRLGQAGVRMRWRRPAPRGSRCDPARPQRLAGGPAPAAQLVAPDDRGTPVGEPGPIDAARRPRRPRRSRCTAGRGRSRMANAFEDAASTRKRPGSRDTGRPGRIERVLDPAELAPDAPDASPPVDEHERAPAMARNAAWPCGDPPPTRPLRCGVRRIFESSCRSQRIVAAGVPARLADVPSAPGLAMAACRSDLLPRVRLTRCETAPRLVPPASSGSSRSCVPRCPTPRSPRRSRSSRGRSSPTSGGASRPARRPTRRPAWPMPCWRACLLATAHAIRPT